MKNTEAIMTMDFENDVASFKTNERTMITKFRKELKKYPDMKFVADDGEYVTIEFPASWFRLPRPAQRKAFTDEQRAVLRENMRLAREKKSNNS